MDLTADSAGSFCRMGATILVRVFEAGYRDPVRLDRSKEFDICFCVVFNYCCQSFLSASGAGYFSILILNFSNICKLLKILSSSRSATHEHLLYKLCYTRYQVSFYLW